MKKKLFLGFTLIELMVGLGLASLVFLFMFRLLGMSANMSALTNNQASMTEYAAESISQLQTVLSQVVRVNSCACTGTGGNLASCLYRPVTAANANYNDPVFTYSNSADVVVLDADFESYFGGTGASFSEISRSSIPNNTGCAPYSFFPSAQLKGCKHRLQLLYRSAVLESGGTPSQPGSLILRLAAFPGVGSPYTRIHIGSRSDTTGVASSRREEVSVSELACGLIAPLSAGVPDPNQVTMNFALDLRLKTRKTTSKNASSSIYESWHRDGVKYRNGSFRDIQMKVSFNNLQDRGVYQWRTQSLRQCPDTTARADACCPNGKTARDRAQCCSNAKTGAAGVNGTCVECVPGGVGAASAEQCCSGVLSGGLCV